MTYMICIWGNTHESQSKKSTNCVECHWEICHRTEQVHKTEGHTGKMWLVQNQDFDRISLNVPTYGKL